MKTILLADDEANLTAGIQEAIELFCEGESPGVPEPSKLADLMNDHQYQGGAWILVDIDTRRLDSRAKRVNISMPVNLLSLIDERASELHLSRSAFLALAAEEKLKESA